MRQLGKNPRKVQEPQRRGTRRVNRDKKRKEKCPNRVPLVSDHAAIPRDSPSRRSLRSLLFNYVR